jgi:putative tryptophan/tyrosine transport system substrate-binding protein
MGPRVVLTILLFAATLAAQAQSAGTLPRLGVLWPGTVDRYEHAFRQGLRDLGYVEGQNILIDVRATHGDFSRAPKLAAELVDLKVDVIFAAVSSEARAAEAAARNAGRRIPIVFGPVPDPIAEGLVVSLARPGGAMTGLMLFDPAFLAKQLDVLKESVTKARRLAWIDSPQRFTPQYAQAVRTALTLAAQRLRVQLEAVEMNKPADVSGALETVARKQPDALLVPMSPVTIAARHRIVEFAAEHGLPAMYGDALFVEDGGLMFYGTSFASYFQRAAVYVDRILKGANPADLPVEQPTTIELVINMKTAKALGLTLPPEILLRADKIIE